MLEKPQEKTSLSFPSAAIQTPTQNKKPTSHKQTPNYQVKKRSNRKIWLWVLSSVSMIVVCVTLLSWHQKSSTEAITTLAKQEQPIIKLDGASYAPKLSLKNGRFVFLHKTPNANNSQVYLGHIDNSPAKALTDDGFYYMDAIIANNAVYATRFNNLSERKCDIVKIALTGNKTDVIKACSAHTLTKLDYSPNTEALFFNFKEEQDQPYTIYSYSLETGQTNPVTQESHNKHGLYLLDQARNVEQKVDANFPLNLWAHWQIRNQNLYVQRNRAIEKIALSSFAVVDLYDLSNIVANYFSISRNEHLLVVDKIERSETYIWLGDVITQ